MYSRRHRRPPARRRTRHRRHKNSDTHTSYSTESDKHSYSSELRRRSSEYDNKTSCFSSTFHGLHHWHKHAFEHLGWMVLAKSHGYMDKVRAYQSSLQQLKHSLECRIRTIHDVDRKCDLKTLHTDIVCLIDHADQDF